MERTANISGRFRWAFAVAAMIVLCPFARETTIPAVALPTSNGLAEQAVPPEEILASVTSGKITTLTRVKSGFASWYGKVLQGHPTASGRRFNMYEMTAAHRSLPFGSKVKVTDLRNHRSVVVTITDRGVLLPDRVIDLSFGAARQLKMVKTGVDPVKLEVLSSRNLPLVAARAGF